MVTAHRSMQPPNHAFNRDPPVRAFYLAIIGGGGPVKLVLLGVTQSANRAIRDIEKASPKYHVVPLARTLYR
jgi:hypothetical protein